jgi:hypothetical protein
MHERLFSKLALSIKHVLLALSIIFDPNLVLNVSFFRTEGVIRRLLPCPAAGRHACGTVEIDGEGTTGRMATYMACVS